MNESRMMNIIAQDINVIADSVDNVLSLMKETSILPNLECRRNFAKVFSKYDQRELKELSAKFSEFSKLFLALTKTGNKNVQIDAIILT
jgi:hypothetical protein